MVSGMSSWLVFTPGAKPKLVYLQPFDYWHVVPNAPAGYWVEQFDIVVIRTPGGRTAAKAPSLLEVQAAVDDALVFDLQNVKVQAVLKAYAQFPGYSPGRKCV